MDSWVGDPTKVPPGSFVWRVEPIKHALTAAAQRQAAGPAVEPVPGEPAADKPADGAPPALCSEVGRRLLLCQFQFSEWVLRRVEKVHFERESRVSRRTSIELRVPEEAPVIMDDDGITHWLVPLTLMRRRTLANLNLRDEDDRSVSLLGLRFTQRLDESMLAAAASLAGFPPGDGSRDELRKFIRTVVSGTYEEVMAAKGTTSLVTVKNSEDLFADPVFSAALERLWHNFTLYVTLPVAKGRHRLLRMAFEEPVEWRYQRGVLTPLPTETGRETVQYQPLQSGMRTGIMAKIPSRFGWAATRIRFLTPSAENCASYHFEFTAPPGVRIAKARLLAGRPNKPAKRGDARAVSVDGVDGHGETVGLHAVEIPNVSLSRVQIDLRIPSRGWLSTLSVACLVVLAVLALTTWQLGVHRPETAAEATALFVVLVTIAGAAATYVAQRDHGDVAARMLTGLRFAGLVAISAPVLAGMAIVFLQAYGFRDNRMWIFTVLIVLAAAATIGVLGALFASWVAEFSRGVRSPWDMAGVDHTRARSLLADHLVGATDFFLLIEPMGFHKAAAGVYSSEGWHEKYTWNAKSQRDAVRHLTGGPAGGSSNPTRCVCTQVERHVPQPSWGAVWGKLRR